MQEEPQVVVRVVVGARQPVWLPGKHALASFLQTIKITTERASHRPAAVGSVGQPSVGV